MNETIGEDHRGMSLTDAVIFVNWRFMSAMNGFISYMNAL
jgi:hypothetical protein